MTFVNVNSETLDKIRNSFNGVFANEEDADQIIVDVERAGEEIFEYIPAGSVEHRFVDYVSFTVG